MVHADYKTFYDERRHETYSHDYSNMQAKDHRYYQNLKNFIKTYSLSKKKCLEIGSSGGFFQDMVTDYYGTDIAESLAKYYHKPYSVAPGTAYPFKDEIFDAIWTINVYEHIPHLQEALLEIKRLLKSEGLLFFAPAWYCRPWAAKGYAVRPYSELGLKEKFVKVTLPIRNSVLWRSMFILPKRFYRHCKFFLGHKYSVICYKKLNPNYDIYWAPDSDACNSIDPHDVILWFTSHGFKCISHPMHIRAFLVRTGALIFKKM